MAVFNYTADFRLGDEEAAILSVRIPDPGTAAHHVVDLPPNETDFNAVDQFSRFIGHGFTLKKERTVIFSKVVNLDSGNQSVNAKYFINGVELITRDGAKFHSNPKSLDPSPLIIVNVFFV
jgi:hypothetical protein